MSYSDWKLSFQVSPIILTYGIASSTPGGMVPIISLTESNNFDFGLLSSGSPDLNLDDFFAQYEPLPGSNLESWAVGEYPFANQAVAANAVIAQPLRISLKMICPVRNPGGYAAKLATISSLKASLDSHIGSGGTFTVATPSFIYTNCLLLGLDDVSDGTSQQAQTTYQWNFYKPLLTLEEADQAQNSLMSKISSGTALPAGADGSVGWSGLAPTVGLPPSLAATSLVPAASSAVGAGTSSSIASPSGGGFG